MFDILSLQDLMTLIAEHGDAVYTFGFSYAFARTGFLLPLLAGYAAHHGALDLGWTVAVFWAGSWLGDEARYWIGRRWGHRLVAKVGFLKRPVEIVLAVLNTRPVPFILGYRFARGMRSVAGIAVGMTAMPWLRFAPLNFLAAGLWAGVFVGAGHALCHVSEKLLGNAANWATLGLLAVFVLAGWLIARRVRVVPVP